LSALLEEVAPTAADPDPDPLDLDKPPPDLVTTEHELDSETPIDEALPDLSGLLEVLDDADSSDVSRDADVAEVPEYAEAENAGTKVVSTEEPAGGPEPAFEPAGSGRPRVAWPAPVRVDDSNSDGDKKGDSEDRQSRYSSHSAQLPQLGEKAQSNASTIANLRKKGLGRR
jgi:hypothetical protein